MSFFSMRTKRKSLGSPIELAEVDALVRYAMEQGLDPKGEVIPLLERQKAEWKKDLNNAKNYNAMLVHYATLSAKTKPISGRVLLDSEKSDLYLRWLVIWTVLFIVVAAADGIMALWFSDCPKSVVCEFWGTQAASYILKYMRPFIWGALGACVYLLKHLYDLAGDQRFDAALFRGWWVRLVLGAVLGGVVNQIFHFTNEEASKVAELSANAVAFLTGLGVRVVYGAFERTVELLAEKMNLGQVRTGKQAPQPDDARTLLSKALANIDPNTEPQKHMALVDLIRDLNKKEEPDAAGGGEPEPEAGPEAGGVVDAEDRDTETSGEEAEGEDKDKK